MQHVQENNGRTGGRTSVMRRITIRVTEIEHRELLLRSPRRQVAETVRRALRIYSRGMLDPLGQRPASARFRKREIAIRVPAEHAACLPRNGRDGELSDLVVRVSLALPPVRGTKVPRQPVRRGLFSDDGRRLAALAWIGNELEALLARNLSTVSGAELASLVAALVKIADQADQFAGGATPCTPRG